MLMEGGNAMNLSEAQAEAAWTVLQQWEHHYGSCISLGASMHGDQRTLSENARRRARALMLSPLRAMKLDPEAWREPIDDRWRSRRILSCQRAMMGE
jgi:hypothetical protein